MKLAVPQGVGSQKPAEPVLVGFLELERADLKAVGTGLMLGLMLVEGSLVLQMGSQVLPRATWRSP